MTASTQAANWNENKVENIILFIIIAECIYSEAATAHDQLGERFLYRRVSR